MTQPPVTLSPATPTSVPRPAALPIEIGGESFLADPSGALIWPRRDTMLVADLHFEKGSAFARKGQLLPPYDSLETLMRLEDLVATYGPRRILCLGDSFHDRDGPARLDPLDRQRLTRLVAAHDWIWITGNHDHGAAASLGGTVMDELLEAGVALRHEAAAAAAADERLEISGHFHPKAILRVRGRRLSRRCFAGGRAPCGRDRLVLPAFGAYTGGLNVLDPAVARLFAGGFDVWATGDRAVHRLPSSRLDPDQPHVGGHRPSSGRAVRGAAVPEITSDAGEA
ncbi:ligase-associated DNA damage response endonuclease PdeM [Tistrella mobilis]|uniref:ligase-associated DNA damage response endonuclease PdeM n=1 Tax=Tistrella mobilis TaxID=171437 RepID=UPI003557A8F1